MEAAETTKEIKDQERYNWLRRLDNARTLEAVVSKVFNISHERLLEKTRKREIKDARFVYFYILVNFFKYTSLAIERITGWDHASVLNGCKKVDQFTETESIFSWRIQRVIDEIMTKTVLLPKDPGAKKEGRSFVYQGTLFIAEQIDLATKGSATGTKIKDKWDIKQ